MSVILTNLLIGPTSDTYSTLLGTVTGEGPVSISGGMVGAADNSVLMLFVATSDGTGYLYNTLTNDFDQITDEGFLGSTVVGNLDGHFIFVTPKGLIQFSQGSNPVTFEAHDIQDVYPDKIVSLIIDHREIWVFGSNSVSVWYNDGSADFLARIQGAFNEIGCAAPFSIAKLDNGIFWLGQDARGQGIVYRSNGYSGQRISTHAVEWQIQQYGDLSDAIAYAYQQDGHSFYVLTFPSADATWVYDVATQAWHERAGFVDGAFTRHRSNCQVCYDNEVLVGDYENGNLYAFDLNTFDDNGAIQKWLRSWRVVPPGQNDLKRTTHHSLQLDCETGAGADDGNNPQAMLRWSDDGGHSWSNEHWASLGTLGQYGRRVIWRRLGMTTKLRDRVYEVSGTDTAKIVILGAELLIGPTNA